MRNTRAYCSSRSRATRALGEYSTVVVVLGQVVCGAFVQSKHDDCFHSAGPTTTAVPRPRRTPTRVARHRRPGNRPSAENSSPRSPFVRRLYSPLPPAVFEGPRIGDSFASRGRGLSVRTLERASFVNNAVSNVNPESAVPARTISHCGNRTCVQCIHGRCVRFGNRSSALTAP